MIGIESWLMALTSIRLDSRAAAKGECEVWWQSPGHQHRLIAG